MQVVQQDDSVESTGTKSALPATSALPACTATAQLAAVLLRPTDTQGHNGCDSTPPCDATGCAAVLAAAPWIPQGKWQSALTELLHSNAAQPQDAARRLRRQLTAVNLVLQHGQHAGTGMPGWLAVRISARGWATLPAALRAYLCLHTARLLAQLPSAAAAQLVERVKGEACGSRFECTALQCAACLGLEAALRCTSSASGVAAGTAQASSAERDGASADRLRSALHSALQAAVLDGPAMPAAWQRPHAAIETPPHDAAWRLVCDSSDVSSGDVLPEAAVRAAQRSCWPVEPDSAGAPASHAHVIDDWASWRGACGAPRCVAGQQLAQWSWWALRSAAQGHGRPVLEELLASQRGAGSAPQGQGCRALALHALYASEQPTGHSQALADCVGVLSNVASDASADLFRSADNAAGGEWWAACCTVAAAIGRQEASTQRTLVTDLLRTVKAAASGLREQLGSQQPVPSAKALAPLQRMLAFAGACVWEVARALILAGQLVEIMPLSVRCPLHNPDAVFASGAAAAEEAQQAAVSALPHALPALLTCEAWRQDTSSLLRVVFSIWREVAAVEEAHGRQGIDYSGHDGALNALREVLQSCWGELLPEERAALLPGLLYA